MENWKEVPGYEGFYEVSNFGRIRRKNRIIKGDQERNGYRRVRLCVNGKGQRYMVHRLVLLAFVGPCPEGKEAHHKDSDPPNCRLNNLEYLTHGQNLKHAYDHNGRKKNQGEIHGMHKLTDKQVLKIRSTIGTCETVGKLFHVSPATISLIRNHKIWRHI
jgi:NUMOD4 motif/HNH endonuclease